MEMFTNYQLTEDNNGYILTLYLNPTLVEFSSELGMMDDSSKANSLEKIIGDYVHNKLPNLKVHTVKVMAGSLLIATLTFAVPSADAKANSVSEVQTTTYTVKPGDSLWKISNAFGISISEIQAANNLSDTVIYAGQNLKIPLKAVSEGPEATTTYTVKAGDTLWKIANLYGITVAELQSANNLSSTVIYVGQNLIIPKKQDSDTQQDSTVYTVKAGDTLWKIANQFKVSIDHIKQVNHLSDDMIYVGQKLKINADTTTETPKAPIENTITYETYEIKAGDNIWSLSIKFGIPMTELLEINNLTTNSILYIGQKIKVPVHHIAVKETVSERHGEYLDWWTEAQYLLPIGKIATVTDFETGKSFQIQRTIGANHADCEPLTANDALIIKEIWGGSYSWKERAVIVHVDGRKIAASMASMPHDIEYITGNNFEGHFDLHFKNSTRHSDGLVSEAHQRQVRIAAGIISE